MPDERGLVIDHLGVAGQVPTPKGKEQQDDEGEEDDPTHAHERVGHDPQDGLIQRQGGDAVAGDVVCRERPRDFRHRSTCNF